MRIWLGLGVLVGICAITAFASAPDSGDSSPSHPDGVLVLGVVYRHGGVPTERVVVADPRTGLARARRLEGGALCHGPVLAVDDRVIASGSRGRRSVVLSFPLNVSERPGVLAAADQFVPSSSPGRLWVAENEPDRRTLRFSSLREVTASGRTVYRVRRDLPRWSAFQGAVAGNLILGRGNDLELWDPRAGRVVRRLNDAWVIATNGSRMAWCSGNCRAIRLSTRARHEHLLRLPDGTRLTGTYAAFSPDGSRLAVSVVRRGHTRVALVDLDTGGWRMVPGDRLRGYPSIAWSPSGRWLYFTTGGRRLIAWRDGAPRPVRLPIRPRGEVLSIGTASAAERSGPVTTNPPRTP
jgi:hypothetical protein